MNRLLLAIFMLTSFNALADLNKWVDENGKVHYSDTPPPSNVKVKKLHEGTDSSQGGTAGNAAPPEKTLAEKEADLKKAEKDKQDAAAKAAKEQAAADTQKANCENAKSNLAGLQAGGRMVEYNDKGERNYMDDAERQRRIDQAQQEISTNCK